MVKFYVLATTLCFINYGNSQEDCFPSEWLKSLSMSVKISKAGFHRDLQYSVQWRKIDHDILALLVQKMPSGVYMDEYQLETLRRETGLEVLLDSKVDLEAPEYLSSGFTALVFLSAKDDAVVPVHGRYHRPSGSSKRVKVDIESPRLLLRSDQCQTLSAGLRRVVVDAPCNISNHSICSWVEILGLEDNGGVSLEIPVGDSSMIITVCRYCTDDCIELRLPAQKHLETLLITDRHSQTSVNVFVTLRCTVRRNPVIQLHKCFREINMMLS